MQATPSTATNKPTVTTTTTFKSNTKYNRFATQQQQQQQQQPQLTAGLGTSIKVNNPTTKTLTTTTTTTTTTKTKIKSNSTAASSSSSSTAVAITAATKDTNSEIEEISKQISEHADALYRTWKSRGLAPTELLDFYTNTATANIVGTAVTAKPTATTKPIEKTIQISKNITVVPGTGADSSRRITGGRITDDKNDFFSNDDVHTTEGLQKFVNSFVIKDKEQRGVKLANNKNAGGGGGNLTKCTNLKQNNNSHTDHSIANRLITAQTATTTTTAVTAATNVNSKILENNNNNNNIINNNNNSNSSSTGSSSVRNNKINNEKIIQKVIKPATQTTTAKTVTTTTTTGYQQCDESRATSPTIKKFAKSISSSPSSALSPTATTTPIVTSVLKNSNTNSNKNNNNNNVSNIIAKNDACVVNNIEKLKTTSTKLNDQQPDDTTLHVKKKSENKLKTTTITTGTMGGTTAQRSGSVSPINTTTIIQQKSRTPSPTPSATTEFDANLIDVNNLSQLQTENLQKIKELLQQEQAINSTKLNVIKKLNTTEPQTLTVRKVVKKQTNKTNDVKTPTTTKSENDGKDAQSVVQQTIKVTKKLAKINNNNNDVKTNGNTTNTITCATTSILPSTPTSVVNADTATSIINTKTTTTPTTTTATKTKTSSALPLIDIGIDEIDMNNESVAIDKNSVNKSARQIVKIVQVADDDTPHQKAQTPRKLQETGKTTTTTTTTTTTKNSNKILKVSNNNHSNIIKTGLIETADIVKTVPLKEKSNKKTIALIPTIQTELSDKKINGAISDNTVMEIGRSTMPTPTKMKSTRSSLHNGQDKNLGRPILTRGSVAERVMMFEKCPDVRNSFLNIKRPDPADAPPKSLLKVKLHSTPPSPPEQNSIQKEFRSTRSVYIPRFYFPHGKPQPQIALERTLRGILSAFDSFPNNQVTKDELPRILKLCGIPFYWRMPIMIFCQQGNSGLVERQRFVEFWKQMNVYCHDAASRFVYILSRGQRIRSYIVPEDLASLVQDVVDTHPGLAFLKEAIEFHSRYVHTVIARIFYSVNRSWSGRITISELKKSDLLEIISLLEEEDDINHIMAFFSYEHFYVIYCKFWELDKDHDLLINQDDLARHSDHALSTRIVERIFSGCVTRTDNKRIEDEPKMSYTDFVWFLLSEEDKRTPTAIEYWFRCMDIDGDGALSMYELEYFYEEQQQRMESIGIETLPFEDCLCQMLDMIKPQRRDCITLGDLKRCKMTHVFFDTFFNLEKYLDHEQRDPFATQRDEYASDWDRFAAQEYELLITEEN